MHAIGDAMHAVNIGQGNINLLNMFCETKFGLLTYFILPLALLTNLTFTLFLKFSIVLP